ncbi:MAG: hypothetical protein Q8W45_07170 [Candidatus Palauibacterales bacterium]|nr:hypothetical protein [Candidatus Palauibacterales bacterium]MDP2483046.1 hypothetical protein [Candidatus Palauibacterales bacterium]
MKRALLFGLAALLVPGALAAQSANPTTDAARRLGSRLGGYLMAAADQVPADKLSYKPTEAQMTLGGIWAHLAGANYGICAGIGGMEAPSLPERDGTEPKDTLVKELKASFAFCDQAFEHTDDSSLGEEVSLGFMNGTRAFAMFVYVEDLADHYSQVANYMRLNGMLPPSAK